MEKRKNYITYMIIVCIILLILLGGIGLFLIKENRKPREKKSIGNYICQFDDCEAIINNQENSLLVYDSSYYFWDHKTNQFVEIKEIDSKNIFDYQIIDHYVKIEYQNQKNKVYDLSTGKETNYIVLKEDQMIIYDDTSWSLYSLKEEKLLSTYPFLTEHFLEGRNEIKIEKKEEKNYYVIHYVEELEETKNEIYTSQNYYTKDYFFNILNTQGNMILTDQNISPNTGCGDFNVGYEHGVSSFIEMDELGNIVRKSHDYQSILTIRNSQNLDFFLAIQENQLKLYNLEEEELYNFGEWNEQKNVAVQEDENRIILTISEVSKDIATLYTYYKNNQEVTSEDTTSFCQI